jgi:hypothetical protein
MLSLTRNDRVFLLFISIIRHNKIDKFVKQRTFYKQDVTKQNKYHSLIVGGWRQVGAFVCD